MYNHKLRVHFKVIKDLKKIKLNSTDISVLLTGILLLVYSVIRAATLSFTIDESATFFYIKNMHISHLANGFNANTHMLNTFLTGIFYLIFGISEWALRLPNLLAHALFIYYTYLITKKWFKGVYLIAGFLLLNLNPFMFEFFSLSRGYGLSIAFSLASIYHLISVFEKPTTNKEISKTLIFGCLAVFSNLMALNYFLVLIAILVYFKWKELRQNKIVLILTIATLLLNVHIGIFLKDKGQLYYGGTTGLHQDTIQPIINAAAVLNFHRIELNAEILNIIKLIATIAFYLLSASLFIIFKWAQTFNKKQPTENLLFLILLGTFLSPVIQFYLMDTPLPHKRTALLITFIFSLNFVFLFKKMVESKNKILSTGFKAILVLSSVLVLLNFVNSINLRKTMSWPEQADIKTFVSDLKAEEPQANEIMVEWYLERATSFYILKNEMETKVTRLIWEDPEPELSGSILFIPKSNMKKISTHPVIFKKEYPETNMIFIKLKGFKTL